MTYRIVYGQNGRAAAWCVDQGWSMGDTSQSIALERDGRLVAVALFDDYRGSDIRLHLARDPDQHFGPRAYIAAIWRYAFVQLPCVRVSGLINEKNAASIRLAEHAGFKYETRLSRAFRGEDLLVFVMWKNQCKFLSDRYLRTVTHETTPQA